MSVLYLIVHVADSSIVSSLNVAELSDLLEELEDDDITYYERNVNSHVLRSVTLAESRTSPIVYVLSFGQVVDDFLAALGFQPDAIESIYDVFEHSPTWATFWRQMRVHRIPQAVAKFIFRHARTGAKTAYVLWGFCAELE